MQLSAGSLRKSVMKELCEESKEQINKEVGTDGRLVRSVRRMDPEYLDVDESGEMNETTTQEVIAKTMKRYPDPQNKKTEVDGTPSSGNQS